MSKATDVLDDLAKSERRRSRRYFFIGAAIVITILLGGFLGTAGETKQVEGTVRSLYGRVFSRICDESLAQADLQAYDITPL